METAICMIYLMIKFYCYTKIKHVFGENIIETITRCVSIISFIENTFFLTCLFSIIRVFVIYIMLQNSTTWTEITESICFCLIHGTGIIIMLLCQIYQTECLISIFNVFEFFVYPLFLFEDFPPINKYIQLYCLIYVSSIFIFIVSLLLIVRVPTKKSVMYEYQKLTYNEILGDNLCPVCGESFDLDPNIFQLTCKHYAHIECLNGWWKQCQSDGLCVYFCQKSVSKTLTV
jgi:hypothetical protein